MGRFRGAGAGGEGLENQLGNEDERGEVDGVVTAVDVGDDVLENDNQERREEVGEEDVEDEMEQATHGEAMADLSVVLRREIALAGALPVILLRSSASHCTTLRRESKRWCSRRFLESMPALLWCCSGGKSGPCMLARTSLKGTVRESSWVERVNGGGGDCLGDVWGEGFGGWGSGGGMIS
jgi:hypothetical protein